MRGGDASELLTSCFIIRGCKNVKKCSTLFPRRKLVHVAFVGEESAVGMGILSLG